MGLTTQGGIYMATETNVHVRTGTLMRRLFSTKSIDDYLRQNTQHLKTETFCECLRRHCLEKGLVAEHVIEHAQIERTYGHQLFNGTRNPSRDKVLQFAFGLGLSVEETQQLLRSAAKSLLYPRIRRDAIVIYALKEHWKMTDVQEVLDEYHLSLLGGEGKNG